MARAVALSLSDLTKTYGSVRALDHLNLEVPEGCFFILFGPSSVGKTTTLRAISGLVPLDSGTIHIGSRDVTNAPIRGRGVSMVFQSFALYSHLNVFKNLAYPLVEDGLPRAEIAQRVGETAEMLKLSHRLQQKPATLSGGEQQRVALGRSLIHRPKLLLLDEPLTNLDAKLRFDMRAELKRLHRQFGMTVVYATPDELEALSMGEQIAVLRDGRAVQQGSPDDLYETPVDRYVASKIGSPHMNIFDVKVGSDGVSLETPFGPLRPSRLAEPMDVGEFIGAWRAAVRHAPRARRARLERTNRSAARAARRRHRRLAHFKQPSVPNGPAGGAGCEHQGRRSASDYH